MKGYPKHLNSREDVDVALSIDEERTKDILRQMLNERENWFFISKLESKEAGVDDATHKVLCDDPTVEEEKQTWSQYALGTSPSSPLARIGLTVKDARAIIKE